MKEQSEPPGEILTELCRLAEQAGAKAMRFYDGSAAVTLKKILAAHRCRSSLARISRELAPGLARRCSGRLRGVSGSNSGRR